MQEGSCFCLQLLRLVQLLVPLGEVASCARDLHALAIGGGADGTAQLSALRELHVIRLGRAGRQV